SHGRRRHQSRRDGVQTTIRANVVLHPSTIVIGQVKVSVPQHNSSVLLRAVDEGKNFIY
ncbi:unnamed protein product, partial [Musa acuminata var. zebrina]